MTLSRSIAFAVVGLALTACSSVDFDKVYRDRLTADSTKIEAGQLKAAATDLEAVLAETKSDSDKFGLQRHYALWMLTRTHALASAGHAFIADPRGGAASVLGGSSGPKTTEIAHVMALLRLCGYGRDLGNQGAGDFNARKAQCLPAALKDVTPKATEQYYALCALAAYTRLGFDAKSSRIIEDSPPLRDLKQCDALIADAHLDPSIAIWVHQAAFDYERVHDEASAFGFGERVLAEVRDKRGDVGEDRTKAIRSWMTGNPNFEFVCPKCHSPIFPELSSCANDQTPNADFVPRPKKSAK